MTIRAFAVLAFSLGVFPLASSAQPSGRVAVGAGTASPSDLGRAFGNLVVGFGQVAPGLSAQRAYPVWWVAEAEARSSVWGSFSAGGRLQGRWSQADALYGDYAGTVDVVGRTRAVLAEVEVSQQLREGPLRAALHGGVVVTSTQITAEAVATVEDQTERTSYRLTGSGTGPTVGASLLAETRVGGIGLAARLGARWGHVTELDARETTPTSQTEGRLRLRHGFSGLTLTVGVGF